MCRNTLEAFLAKGIHFALGFSLTLFLLLLSVECAHAEIAVVVRDGSLVFEEPNSDSAVLDILARGTDLEVLERGGDWCKVLLPDMSREGYIRTDAVETGESVSSQYQRAPGTSSSLFLKLQGKLDNTEAKLRQALRLLDNLEQMLELQETGKLGEAGGGAGASAERFAPGESRLARMASGNLSFNIFYGLFFKDNDFTAGGSLVWSPRFFAPFSLEVESGSTFLAGEKDALYANLDLLYPLPWEIRGIRSYLALGAGMVRLELESGAGIRKEVNPAANLGIGAIVPLVGKLNLRADMRSRLEFRDGEKVRKERFYLAFYYPG